MYLNKELKTEIYISYQALSNLLFIVELINCLSLQDATRVDRGAEQDE